MSETLPGTMKMVTYFKYGDNTMADIFETMSMLSIPPVLYFFPMVGFHK